MLDNDQHDRGEGNDPKQGVTKGRAGRQVRGPISGIDESYSDQQPRTDVFQQIQCPRMGVMVDFQFVQKRHTIYDL